jgi:hypothetical protein
MLAYVFWHWRRPSVSVEEYETAQRDFHAALAAAPSAGFLRSFSHAIVGAPWANGGAEAYEDWYLVRDSAALDALNEGAMTASRRAPHDAAAAGAAGGTAGLFRLRVGDLEPGARWAHWFARPEGVGHSQLVAELAATLAAAHGSLWVRQMTLGPSPECCVLARGPLDAPLPYRIASFALRPVVQYAPAGGTTTLAPSNAPAR